MNPQILKQEIRDRMRALRQALSPEEVARASEAVSELVFSRRETADAGAVCSYAAVGQEIRTGPLLGRLLASGKSVCIPDWEGWNQGEGLRVVRIEGPQDLLTEGRAVPRPRIVPERVVAVEDLDLFLVPGLAFDRAGARLGMGGGFFDRLLKLISPRATTFGLAYDFQVIERLPVEPHDVPVHYVIHPGEGASGARRSCAEGEIR